MRARANLFFSPHPDDLVYSAFAAITEHAGKGDAIVFFNATRFTKWGLLPMNVATLVRTVEETIILTRLRLGCSFMWIDDYSLRDKDNEKKELSSNLVPFRQPLRNLFCPLGIGGHPDHLAVRNFAIEYWLKYKVKPRIWFYEDLPYAARIPKIDDAVEKCISQIPHLQGLLTIRYKPLNSTLFRKKLFFSRLYVTQNDHTALFEDHGKQLGKKCDSPYAERYCCSG